MSLLPEPIRAAIEADLNRPRFIDTLMAADAIEGVVVDDSRRIDRLCAGMVESMTEFDWERTGPMSLPLPDHLRESLRQWARDFLAWDREQP